jgi:hypothetical protein
LVIGLDDAQELKRKKPIPSGKPSRSWSKDSGTEIETCRSYFEAFLT